jgi:crossover junction endodeoxyribonuclease RuvC
MIIYGIDPGVNGALALLDSETSEVKGVYDTPTIKRDGAKRKDSDWYKMSDLLAENPDACAIIEDVHYCSGDGGMGSFTFGKSVGLWIGLCLGKGIPFRFVSPQRWKRDMGLIKQEKIASRELALELFPNLFDSIKLVRDHNKAEAVLIAEWFRRNFCTPLT